MPDLSDLWPFIAAFAALVAAGFGAPIPEELPTIGAGIWVATNPNSLGPERWLILPVCIIGVVISDVLLYGMGRLWGPGLLNLPLVARLMPAAKRADIEHNFQRYGTRILLMVRWVPGIRSPMFITAGMMRLPVVSFVLADGVAALAGHSLLFFLAYWFGDSFRELVVRAEHTIDTALKPILVLVAVAGVTLYFLWHFYRRPVTMGDPEEVPLIVRSVASVIEQKAPASQHATEGAPAPNHEPTTEQKHPA